MRFNAEQMRLDALIPKGKYKFRVLHTKQKTSSNNTEMFNLKIAINVHGRELVHFTNLFFSPKMFWMIEHFCKSTGMPEKIDEGSLNAEECDGKEGELIIEHRINSNTGVIEEYVKDYTTVEVTPFNDDIPSFN